MLVENLVTSKVLLVAKKVKFYPCKWSNIGFGREIGIIEIKIRTLSGALAVMPVYITPAGALKSIVVWYWCPFH